MKCINKIVLLSVSFIIISELSNAQSEIGFRVTPVITSQPKLINPSAAQIYGESSISLDAGVDYTHIFRRKSYGIRIGTGIGIVDHNYVFQAPRNAFGTMTGEGLVYTNDNYENYFYNSVSAQFVYRIELKNLTIEAYTGLTKKFYQNDNEPDSHGYAFNRAQPYNFDDPAAGSPDWLINFPPIKSRLHLDIPLGIGIKRVYSDRSSLTFGLVKNWNIQPIAKGAMFVQMHNQFYYGEFSPRSSFVGIDIRYGYNLSKKVQERERSSLNTVKSGYKKAVFIELFGNGHLGSVNYDIRLKKDQNDGLGLRVGVGKGGEYETDNPTNIGRYTTLPININYVKGRKRSGLETGLGITPFFTTHSVSEYANIRVSGFLNVNYRYQPIKEGLVFRAGLTPTFDKREFEPLFFGASIGYGFK